MSNLVPLAIREYIQKIDLSAPIGVGVYVVGDTALDIHIGNAPQHISLYVTGAEILTEGKHFTRDEDMFLDQLTFFGKEFDSFDGDDCENSHDKVMQYHKTSIEGVTLGLYLVQEQMGVLTLLKCQRMDILKCYIKDVASLDWEPSVVNHALDKKEVQVYNDDNVLFTFNSYEYIVHDLVDEYKKKFPGFRFYMEL